jgi:hypothetical protein
VVVAALMATSGTHTEDCDVSSLSSITRDRSRS